jgi:hypothetical protein
MPNIVDDLGNIVGHTNHNPSLEHCEYCNKKVLDYAIISLAIPVPYREVNIVKLCSLYCVYLYAETYVNRSYK